MISCVYPYCRKESKSAPDVIFFHFPGDLELRKRWLQSMPQSAGVQFHQINTRSYLCSDHFGTDSFQDVSGVKRLKLNAVPTVFEVPQTGMMDFCTVQEAESEPAGDAGTVSIAHTSDEQSKISLLRKARSEKSRVHYLKGKIDKLEKKLKRLQNLLKGDEIIPDDIQEMLAVRQKLKSQEPKEGTKHRRRPKTMEELIVFLQKESLVSESALDLFQTLFGDTSFDQQSMSQDVTETLRCFAQILIFYSASAYVKIYEAFHILLPPLPAIRTWFNHDIGEPGWSYEAFSALKEKAKNLTSSNKLLCSLTVEELDLGQEEEWDGKKIRGFVDYGPQMISCEAPHSDSVPYARRVLLFMVAPLDKGQSWRIPVAYFLINHLTNNEIANVIRECLWRLHLIGTIILSLTVNVHLTCQSMFEELGIRFEQLPHVCPYFVHPADPLIRVHIVYDPCTLLEGIRNMWFNSKLFVNGSGGNIDWNYVAELMKVQEAQASTAEGSEDASWCWDSSSMRNRLLAQLFSTDVADTMQYYCHELKMTQFQGCHATVEFIQIMSKIFDLLNSQHRFSHVESSRSFIVEALDFIFRLEDRSGQPLYLSSCRWPVIHLYMTLMSVQALHLQVSQLSLQSLSLGHSNILFYTIQSYIGWNCLPTARQFVNAFKIHVQKYNYLNAWSNVKVENFWWVDILDVSATRKGDSFITKPILITPSIVGNLPFADGCVFPITEFESLDPYLFMSISVVKNMSSVLHCSDCLLALQAKPVADTPLLHLLRKTCGGVIHPSRDVLAICRVAEHHLKVAIRTATYKTKFDLFEWRDKNLLNRIGISVLKDVLMRSIPVFSSLQQHVLECAPDANHVYRLVRALTYSYLCMRVREMKSWCPV